MRINKWLATAGLGSRRGVEELVRQKKVKVNGETVYDLGRAVKDGDVVEVEGKEIKLREEKEYYMVYKPRGVVSSVKDPQGREVVVGMVKSKARLFPVGRLDKESEGLLILTNDGELAFGLTHPSREVEKEYVVGLRDGLSEGQMAKLRQGVRLEEGLARPVAVGGEGRRIKIVLKEGKKREIRRMIEMVTRGKDEVIWLKRERMGELLIGEMKSGEVRKLSDEEIVGLKKIVKLK